jgi:hypothetical protein
VIVGKSHRYSFCYIHILVQFDQVILTIRRIVNSLKKHKYSTNYLALIRSKTHSNIFEKRTSTTNSKMILLDYFPIPHWIGINSIAARVIQEKTGGEIFAFGFMKPFKNTKDLYRAFGISNHLQIKLGLQQIPELWKLYKKIVLSISKSEDVFTIELDTVKIGIPIYESILRSGKITVNKDDIETYKQIYRGLLQYIYFRKLLSENRIEAILVSHDCYIGPGLLDHMAHRFGIPSIYVNPFEINLPYEPQQLYRRFERYPEYFNAIPPEIKDLGLAQAKSDLSLRLSGKIGIKMGYQEQSAFESTIFSNQLEINGNLNVLVATHDFYDNPQSYGEMLFHDFYIWLEFLNHVASETNYNWYLKCHKDSSLQQRKKIEEFSLKNPRFKIIEPSVSFHQLANEGLDFVLTCYGSVGHELPLLGVNVLNSSYNPHIAYNFNFHANSVANYRELILNLNELSYREIPITEVYEFFYVHHYLMSPDSFIFPSYVDYLNYIDNRLQSDLALIYLYNNYELISRKVRTELLKSLKNRLVFSIEDILEPQKQLKHPISANNRNFFDKF